MKYCADMEQTLQSTNKGKNLGCVLLNALMHLANEKYLKVLMFFLFKY